MSTPSQVRLELPRVTSLAPVPSPPVTGPVSDAALDGILELADGSAYQGISFGAEGKSVAGECVFQTGALHLSSCLDHWTERSFQEWSAIPNR